MVVVRFDWVLCVYSPWRRDALVGVHEESVKAKVQQSGK